MPVTPSTRTPPLPPTAVIPVTEAAVIAAFARRERAGLALAGDVERIASAARAMATGFRLGGKLIVFGGTGTDAAHIAVEFMHPVVVGKRALPAVALSNGAPAAGGADDEVFAHQVRHWADAADTALGVSRDGRCPSVLRGLEAAGELGLLTVALTGGGGGLPADHVLGVASGDPAVVKEVHVTAYHLLWELVHVFLERLGPSGRGVER
ncbi:SIS domain-containing protein [Streptosporangium sp. NPDC048865]|uniref:D-sedoheptulose-7-phosphate isomerase n=1 Tax=Streptosporangium sp. NPDC048865 TaxID=3155766 RepID=UPI0034302696